MDHSNTYIAPKPRKNNTNSILNNRSSYANKSTNNDVLQSMVIPFPRSSSTIETLGININGTENLDFLIIESNGRGNITPQSQFSNQFNFFEELERDVSQNEFTDEIFSILDNSRSSASISSSDKENEKNFSCGRVSYNSFNEKTINRPNNPFYKNFEN